MCMRVLSALFLLVVASIPAANATAATMREVSVREVAKGLTARHILPRYEALHRATSAMRQAATRHCPDDLDRVKATYHDAMDAWMRVQHIRFGPIERGTRLARIQYWPDRKDRGRRQLADMLRKADPNRLLPDRFTTTSVAVQGLPAAELILYGYATADRDPGYRCQVLSAIGSNLATLSAQLIAEWTAGDRPYRHSLEGPGPDDPRLRSEAEVVALLLTNLHTSLRIVIDQKLDRPMGVGTAYPRRAESWRSRRSLRNIRLNIESLRAMFDGEPGPGLAHLVRARKGGADIAEQIDHVFQSVLLTIDRIEQPLSVAVAEPSSQTSLRFLKSSLETLDALLVEDAATILDVPLGFNALDGD